MDEHKEQAVADPGNEHVEVVYRLTADEFAAMAEAGYGVPFASPVPGDAAAGMASLLERGLLDEAGNAAPVFAGLWRIMIRPELLGEVTRFRGDGATPWFYYTHGTSFVEQFVNESECIIVGAMLDWFPMRVCLNMGLLRDSKAELDPVPDDPNFAIRFSSVATGAQFVMEGSREAPGTWTTSANLRTAPEIMEHLSEGFAALARRPNGDISESTSE